MRADGDQHARVWRSVREADSALTFVFTSCEAHTNVQMRERLLCFPKSPSVLVLLLWLIHPTCTMQDPLWTNLMPDVGE